jgi:TatD DNase family protein
MIETHAHIYDEQFKDDIESIIQNAQNQGIHEIWMPNCDQHTIAGMYALESKYPNFARPMMGLHPCYVKEDFEAELVIVENHLANRKFIMIGEIGLDFYWDKTFVPQQEEAFLRQLALAKKYNLPICIHSRDSFQRVCELIEQFNWPDLRGIFHCFGGTPDDAQRAIDLNFLLGIGGTVTFKNSGVDKIIEAVDLKHIVLETDAPYLAPTPFRGKRNEPAHLRLVAQKIADIKERSIDWVIAQTNQNAKNLIIE